ncbi:pectate lyase [uncultured Duncaniella sp.]|uniref:pectate lyase n=1 Tax=uncultured Duncaniella sp. TaxID=2768039 RepID=UPI0025AA0403|nr:pectate lyase [uncultured Duncaniella sp.]
MKKYLKCIIAVAFVLSCFNPIMEAKRKNAEILNTDPEFFMTEEARRIGDQVILYQRVTGGWPKNIDMARPLDEKDAARVLDEKKRRNDSTTDNNSTTIQMAYLARLYKATGDVKYRDAFRRGVDFLLSGQYKNGGWPQFWPENRGYQIHITYNDNAMVNTMNVIRDLMYGNAPYDRDSDLLTPDYRKRLFESFYRGVECILATQIVDRNGNLTVWCQQHYRDTYVPAPARAYELPSYCSAESTGILALLMEIPEPDYRIKRAVHSGMRWLDDHKITGYRCKRVNKNGFSDTRFVSEPGAGPVWARFYDLVYAEPYVCDRDGIPRRHLDQIGYERRNGYSWYNNGPARLYDIYKKWCDKWDPCNAEGISLSSPGGNERGIMLLDRE